MQGGVGSGVRGNPVYGSCGRLRALQPINDEMLRTAQVQVRNDASVLIGGYWAKSQRDIREQTAFAEGSGIREDRDIIRLRRRGPR